MGSPAELMIETSARPCVLLRYLGELGLALGLATLIPALAAAVHGDWHMLAPFASLAVVLIALGLAARRLPAPLDLRTHEALVIASGAFVLSPLLMSICLASDGIAWSDALFEAISGLTTTGLTTLDSLEERSATYLFARSWLQWIGGLGFVVLSMALIVGPGLATGKLGATSLEPAGTPTSMREHARRVLRVYVALSVGGVLALMALGATPYESLLYTLSAVSTGGFTSSASSLAGAGTQIQAGVLGLCVLGAISLSLYHGLFVGRWRAMTRDLEVRALLVAIVFVAVCLVAFELTQGGLRAERVLALGLLAVSAQTGAGFSTFDVAQVPPGAVMVLVAAMLVGGGHGSTTGGIKLLRLLMLAALVRWLLSHTRLPLHAMVRPKLGTERLDERDLLRVAALALLFIAVLVLSWIPFLIVGYPPLDALFEVASALGTVGLTRGITGPDLETPLRIVLCIDMLLGRVEIIAFLVLISPRTWTGHRK